MQFQLGNLPRINRPALFAWDYDRALLLAAHVKPAAELDTLLTDLQEAIALQWLQDNLNDPVDASPVQVHFFEAEPSPRYAQLKRVLAHSAEPMPAAH